MGFFECISTALDALSQNRIRSLLTMLGVIIGVMSVILLVALGEGAQAYVEREFAGMGSNVLIISPGKQETAGGLAPPVTAGSYHGLTHEEAKLIKRRVRGVKGVSPIVIGAGHVQFGERRRDTTIIGVTPDFEVVRDVYAQVGRFISESDIEKNSRVCVIGATVRDELFGAAPPLGRMVSINRSSHAVVGILERKGLSLNLNMDDVVLIPLPSAQQMFHRGEDRLFQILVAAQRKQDIPYVTGGVREILIQAHDYVEDFTITDQEGMLGAYSNILRALRATLIGIACIALVVGGIGIMNIMLVSVRERAREVGVRMAVGARRADIGLQFLIESTTLGVLGGLAGIFLGWFASILMRIAYPAFPIGLSLWAVVLAFTFSLAVGVFFGVYPALKAASVDPVEALRYE